MEYLGEIANEPGAISKLCDRDRFAGRPSGIRRTPARSPQRRQTLWPTCDAYLERLFQAIARPRSTSRELGRAAICVADDGKTRMDAVKEPNPRKCRTFPRERRRSRKNRYAWLPTAVGAQTGNRFTLIEQLVPSGLGPTTHRHRRADEGFYILEGTCAFNADGKTKSGRILTMRRVTAYFFGPPAGELDKAFRNIFIKHGGRPIGAWATHGAR